MGIDVTALAASKKYTEDTTIGLGAIKGAPCTVAGTETVEGGTNITLKWTGTNGTEQTTTVFIKDGAKGDTGATGPAGPTGPTGPAGKDGKDGKDGSGQTYDDTEVRGLIAALDTKVDNLFDMVDDINYITANTFADMTDPTTLEDGVYICLVKQDENYPKADSECYSTLYICITDDTPSWEFVGKLNVSEKTMEAMITSGISTALTNYYTKSEVDALISGGGSGGSEIYTTYTTTETEIGTFLGKKLYRKVVEVESLPNATTLSVPLGVSVDLPVACYGYAFASGSKFSIPYKNNVYLYIESSTNSLEIVTSSNRTSASAKIVVEYTKTTD